MFPRAHLYWFNDGARRCWSDRRERRRVYRVRPRLMPEAEPLPIAPAPPIAPVLPVLPPAPQLDRPPRPMLFENRWHEANAQGEDDEWMIAIYSTFPPGTEPDVWPVPEPEPPPARAASAETIGTLLVLLMSACWFAARQTVQLIASIKTKG